METLRMETPRMETLRMETLRMETPRMETPRMETPGNFNYFFESIKGDAEELLLYLGFGPSDPLTKIPTRFMRPSSVKGIDYDPIDSIISSTPTSNACNSFAYCCPASTPILSRSSTSILSRSSTLSSNSSILSGSRSASLSQASLSTSSQESTPISSLASSLVSDSMPLTKVAPPDAHQKRISCIDACCQTETPTTFGRQKLDAKSVAFNNLKLSFELYKKHLMKLTINSYQDERYLRDDLASIMILKNRIQNEMMIIEEYFYGKIDANANHISDANRNETLDVIDDERLIRRMASLTKIIQSATIKLVTKRLNL